MTGTSEQGPATPDDIRRTCGDISDAALEAIAATGATEADLEAALAWEARQFERRTEGEGALTGPAAAVRDILFEEEPDWNDEP
jgi:hypothetical protein